jgi:hypothetical protein
MDYEDMIAKMKTAADRIRAEDDNLLRAIAAIAATGNLQIVPTKSVFSERPVICLPERMYDRLLATFPVKPTEGER